METLALLIPKIAVSIGMRLLTESVLEKLIVWAFEKLAASTKTNVDDELLVIVKNALEKKKPEA